MAEELRLAGGRQGGALQPGAASGHWCPWAEEGDNIPSKVSRLPCSAKAKNAGGGEREWGVFPRGTQRSGYFFSLLALMSVWRARDQWHPWELAPVHSSSSLLLLGLTSVFHAMVIAAPTTEENVLTATFATWAMRSRQQVQLSFANK